MVQEGFESRGTELRYKQQQDDYSPTHFLLIDRIYAQEKCFFLKEMEKRGEQSTDII
jgi:hypothetical protein